MRSATDTNVLAPSIGVVGNIAAGSVECAEYLFDLKVLPCIK